MWPKQTLVQHTLDLTAHPMWPKQTLVQHSLDPSITYVCIYPQEQLEEKCNAGITPLAYAAWGASVDALRVLLNRGADPTATDQ